MGTVGSQGVKIKMWGILSTSGPQCRATECGSEAKKRVEAGWDEWRKREVGCDLCISENKGKAKTVVRA